MKKYRGRKRKDTLYCCHLVLLGCLDLLSSSMKPFSLFFFFPALSPAQLSGFISRGPVVSERFLHVLNPFISLCPGKKYIRMKLKSPTGAETRDDMSLSQTSVSDKIGLFLFEIKNIPSYIQMK